MSNHTETLGRNFLTELAAYRSDNLSGLVAAAFGQPDTAALTAALTEAPKNADDKLALYGYHFSVTDELFSCFAVSAGGFTVVEATRTGAELTINVPLNRIRRIAEEVSVDGDRRTRIVIVEVEADVTRIIYNGTRDNADSAGIRNASYVRTGPADDSKLSAWTRGLRTALNHR